MTVTDQQSTIIQLQICSGRSAITCSQKKRRILNVKIWQLAPTRASNPNRSTRWGPDPKRPMRRGRPIYLYQIYTYLPIYYWNYRYLSVQTSTVTQMYRHQNTTSGNFPPQNKFITHMSKQFITI